MTALPVAHPDDFVVGSRVPARSHDVAYLPKQTRSTSEIVSPFRHMSLWDGRESVAGCVWSIRVEVAAVVGQHEDCGCHAQVRNTTEFQEFSPLSTRDVLAKRDLRSHVARGRTRAQALPRSCSSAVVERFGRKAAQNLCTELAGELLTSSLQLSLRVPLPSNRARSSGGRSGLPLDGQASGVRRHPYACAGRVRESVSQVDLSHRPCDEVRAHGRGCGQPGQADQYQSKLGAVAHRVSPSVRSVVCAGASSCMECYPPKRSGQFFPLTLWQAKNLSVTHWQLSLKTNGFLASANGSGSASPLPRSITSRAPSCISATATPQAGKSRRGYSWSSFSRARTAGACSTTSCADQSSRGGSNINSRSRRFLPLSSFGSFNFLSNEVSHVGIRHHESRHHVSDCLGFGVGGDATALLRLDRVQSYAPVPQHCGARLAEGADRCGRRCRMAVEGRRLTLHVPSRDNPGGTDETVTAFHLYRTCIIAIDHTVPAKAAPSRGGACSRDPIHSSSDRLAIHQPGSIEPHACRGQGRARYRVNGQAVTRFNSRGGVDGHATTSAFPKDVDGHTPPEGRKEPIIPSAGINPGPREANSEITRRTLALVVRHAGDFSEPVWGARHRAWTARAIQGRAA
jgi:hypothetical protein